MSNLEAQLTSFEYIADNSTLINFITQPNEVSRRNNYYDRLMPTAKSYLRKVLLEYNKSGNKREADYKNDLIAIANSAIRLSIASDLSENDTDRTKIINELVGVLGKFDNKITAEFINYLAASKERRFFIKNAIDTFFALVTYNNDPELKPVFEKYIVLPNTPNIGPEILALSLSNRLQLDKIFVLLDFIMLQTGIPSYDYLQPLLVDKFNLKVKSV